MMNRDAVLSSEQALDDYFAALLDEELVELDPVQEKQQELVPLASQESHAVPQLQEQLAPSYVTPDPADPLNFPNLEDVQRLLNQLETTNPIDNNIEDINVEALLEKNTDQIAAHILEADASVQVQVEDEIQEWEIKTQPDDFTSVILETADESTISEPSILELSTAFSPAESVIDKAAKIEEPLIVQESLETQTVEDELATPETQSGATKSYLGII
ncbi:hypothetical protein P4S72_28300 [Vibrio sp. PP-XX7]